MLEVGDRMTRGMCGYSHVPDSRGSDNIWEAFWRAIPHKGLLIEGMTLPIRDEVVQVSRGTLPGHGAADMSMRT